MSTLTTDINQAAGPNRGAVILLIDEPDGQLTVQMGTEPKDLPADSPSMIVTAWLAANWLSVVSMAKKAYDADMAKRLGAGLEMEIELIEPTTTIISAPDGKRA